MKVVAVVAALLSGLAGGTPRAEPVGLLYGAPAVTPRPSGDTIGTRPGGPGDLTSPSLLVGAALPRPGIDEIPGHLPGYVPWLADLPILPDEALGADVVMPIPEPASWSTLLAGLAMFFLIAWRRLRVPRH